MIIWRLKSEITVPILQNVMLFLLYMLIIKCNVDHHSTSSITSPLHLDLECVWDVSIESHVALLCLCSSWNKVIHTYKDWSNFAQLSTHHVHFILLITNWYFISAEEDIIWYLASDKHKGIFYMILSILHFACHCRLLHMFSV